MNTLIAIPVFNEERYVDRVLEEVRRYCPNVLVIDDGSTDRTPDLLTRHRVDVIRHAANRGYGRSLRDAFAYAAAARFDWLITMDCDEQHEPRAIPRFVEAARRGDADIISGSRYMPGSAGRDNPPPDRRVINAAMTAEINQRLGLELTDAFCGFKAHRVASLHSLRLTVDGYAFPMQMWVQAAAAGLRIREIPVELIYNDPKRSFGATLDDPAVRLAHYRCVLHRELRRFGDRLPAAALTSHEPAEPCTGRS